MRVLEPNELDAVSGGTEGTVYVSEYVFTPPEFFFGSGGSSGGSGGGGGAPSGGPSVDPGGGESDDPYDFGNLTEAMRAVAAYGHYKIPSGYQVGMMYSYAYLHNGDSKIQYSDHRLSLDSTWRELNALSNSSTHYISLFNGAMERWTNVQYETSDPNHPLDRSLTTANLSATEAMIHVLEHEAYHLNGHPGSGADDINERSADYWADEAVRAYRAAGGH